MVWTKEQAKEYYQKNKKKIRQQIKEWKKNNSEKYNKIHREQVRKWKKDNPEKHKEMMKGVYKRYRKKHPEKIKAQHYANNHKQIGKICEICKGTEKLHFHHTNYKENKGFTVCDRCHRLLHLEVSKNG